MLALLIISGQKEEPWFYLLCWHKLPVQDKWDTWSDTVKHFQTHILPTMWECYSDEPCFDSRCWFILDNDITLKIQNSRSWF